MFSLEDVKLFSQHIKAVKVCGKERQRGSLSAVFIC